MTQLPILATATTAAPLRKGAANAATPDIAPVEAPGLRGGTRGDRDGGALFGMLMADQGTGADGPSLAADGSTPEGEQAETAGDRP